MILNEHRFYNTSGQEIIVLPIIKFLFDHPDYGQHMAQIVGSWANDPEQISISRIQRKCRAGYRVAEAMFDALLCSRIATYFCEPVRAELCLEEDEAKRLSKWITDSIDELKNNVDPSILQKIKELERSATSEEENDALAYDFSILHGHLIEYSGDGRDIVFPKGVKHIRSFLFDNDQTIKSVIFQHGLLYLDEAVFRGCSNLERISFPQTLKLIENDCFAYCTSLKEIILPNSLERVGPGAFQGCCNVTSIRISENLEHLPTQMFYGCKKIETVHIPNFVSEIDPYAFGACDSLKLAYVPKDAQISGDAFPDHTKIIRI